MNTIRKKHISSFHVIIYGFLGAILTGTLLLMLPFSSKCRAITPFYDALFTATSAVCVTGLVVHDTATYWSMFGQFVIMLMIQIGGLGIVTIAVATAMISGKKIGLMQRSTMQESISAPKVGGIVRLTSFILKTTFGIEIFGALCMLPMYLKDFGIRGIWISLFHSVSAFCNAGFDLMGTREKFSSLVSYSDNLLINIVIMLLIITGGIGFLVWDDIKTNKFHWHKYRMQSKVVLTTTVFLITLPAIYFYFCEFGLLSYKDRILSSLFQAVTPRTAGFNTVHTASLSSGGMFTTIVLMFIGGSPGSTAGGIKTTTVFVIFLYIRSYLLRQKDCIAFKHRMDTEAVKKASIVVFINLLLAVSGSMIIFLAQNLPMPDVLFEVFSACGTVGMSTGVTRQLNDISRIVIIILMFCGRMGSLTFAMSFTERRKTEEIRYPEEQIIVG